MARISLPLNVLQAVIDILEKQPFKDVAQVLTAIAQTQEPVEVKTDENKPSTDEGAV